MGVTSVLKNSVRPSSTSLSSPLGDVMLAGGFSIISFVVLHIFFKDRDVSSRWGWAMYYLAFLINYPHFASSYQIFYGDSRRYFMDKSIVKKFRWRMWWAAVAVPALMIGYFVWAINQGQTRSLGFLATAMFFFVGWHYIKQIFGIVVVLSSMKKFYFSSAERWMLLVPLYSLWGISFVNANRATYTNYYFGISYDSFAIWSWVYTSFVVLLVASSMLMLGMLVNKWRVTKQIPPIGALLALLSIYLWFVPWFYNQWYFYVIPFFHSLQYMLFVMAYRRNKTMAESLDEAHNNHLEQSRTRLASPKNMLTYVGLGFTVVVPLILFLVSFLSNWQNSVEGSLTNIYNDISSYQISKQLVIITAVTLVGVLLFAKTVSARYVMPRYAQYLVRSVVLGMIMFSILPTLFDYFASKGWLPGKLSYDITVFGSSAYLFFCVIFINIHHYFIDNVIWKKDSPAVRSYLFAKSD